jgi:hypothetical protein
MFRNRKNTLRALLPDHIVIKNVADFLRRRNAPVLLVDERGFRFLADDVVTQIDTLIADEHRRPGNQLADFVLRLSAERAIKR